MKEICMDGIVKEFYMAGGLDVDFVVIANGQEDARIQGGDVVFCKSCCMVENGDLAAVTVDGELMLKRFSIYDDLIVLRSSGCKDMEFEVSDWERVAVLGKAIAFQGSIL